MKKKILVLIMGLALAVGFSGCAFIDWLEEPDDVEITIEQPQEESEEESESENYEEEANEEPQEEPEEEEIDLSSIPEGFNVGERFPDFQMTDRDGNVVMLSDYRGKPLYLNLFTTWCTYCFYEMPDVQKIYDNYDVNVVLLDLGESVSETDAYASEYGINLPINHVPDWNVAGHNVDGVPVSIILDKNGIVVAGREGQAEYDWMEAAVLRALDE